MKNTLITIVGATAIGKTALSIKLAQHFNCSIVSCDSRQFFKEMSIGTAVPSSEELEAAPHHFIQNRSIFDNYSVGQFEKDALAKLDELFTENPVQIMVGGSGLYIDAVLKGLDYFPEVDASIREKLTKELEENGIEKLQEQLKELDIETYNTITIDNPHRVMRALEVCIGSGKTYSSFKNKPKAPRNFEVIKIGLTADRQIMYDRINKRVDIMLENGLLEEAKKMQPHKDLTALKTVGYRELFEYFEGNFTKEFAIEEIKKNTRRFAKRQGTWFRRDTQINWFDFQDDIQQIITCLEDKI
ncbi:tRNA (adenosine(37)-N6)-dimethylallyltransferase MiaA [Tenacibaculum finnmarkense genomovar finnmarkense]|uniref:tRNA dimethylallyltransferase n=1 Tax=Tenacibaculum finnmarkense genomovar finnmarkense TaxID=1458503 RepID=A0AAP1WGZ1_9FLAO|nr:tRNA (adenosine(37)-N6)-dimethylallyltransferase MiaA [Tenacibaculum finnmarkense]MBE7653511.1 tRNA (adenosine(37)-N6)-dimethylallyltransferase MiaA [Tenacibaculum finnmarkense genomovar finnmarkense]MBE7695815.1 tRNA (adenosine(37)-N6)-dimethylallyltransferase MiaA [Tenacibaculum finnmarkense genomovar finnmarkense]MCD8418300.1 tRNA (adenosine(37)-N6)-dimethylallyltransferase MiaA [Tenacibaculum finnmarkense genomovar finnmarkense]MCD8427945.1 tRNA (adenosine(37)-N6)-dimethylallyltransferas